MESNCFFNDEFYYSKSLPIYYLPLWIFMTTPVIYLLLFSNALFLAFKRFFGRIFTISDE